MHPQWQAIFDSTPGAFAHRHRAVRAAAAPAILRAYDETREFRDVAQSVGLEHATILRVLADAGRIDRSVLRRAYLDHLRRIA
jgi:hypothetical protein